MLAIAAAGLSAWLAWRLAWQRARHEAYRHHLDNVRRSGEAVLLTDARQRVLLINRPAENLLGCSEASALGQALTDVLPCLAGDARHSADSSHVLAGGAVDLRELVLPATEHGPERTVQLNLKGLLGAKEKVELLLLALVDFTERKELQRRLEATKDDLAKQVLERTADLNEARRSLQHALDTMPGGMAYWNRELRSSLTNRVHQELVGLTAEQAMALTMPELLGRKNMAKAQPFVDQVLRGQACSFDEDVPVPGQPGRTRHVQVYLQPDFDESGQVRGFYSLTLDIDELHASRLALAAERERLTEVMAATGVGTWQWDIPSGRIWGDAPAMAVVGLPSDFELTAEHRMTRVHPDDVGRMQQAIREHLSGRSERFALTSRVWHADGRWIWQRDTGRIVQRDASGRALRMVGTNYDASSEHAARQRIEDNERRLTFFQQNIEQGVVVIDSGRVVDASDTLARMFGVATAELIGQSTLDWVAPGDRAEAARRIATDDESPYEVEIVRPDGSMFPARLRGFVSELGGRKVRLTSFTDITESREYARKLEQARADAEAANRAKSQFLANMSHEIRTPLNAVIGLSYLFQDTPLNEAQRALVAKIQLAGRSLLALINDVLDLSKIEAGELVLEDAPFDLAGLLADVRHLLAVQAESKGIALDVSTPEALPTRVRGDELRLRQILVNLVGNAIKFTERGTVELVAARLPHADEAVAQIRLEVRDTGIGIAEEGLARLFAPFSQVDSSNTRRFAGTGLGLSIVRELSEMMGGRCGVESELGHGSCFWVELPLSLALGDTESLASQALSVLLAEDDPEQRHALASMARRLGWQVEAVPDGPALVRRATERLHAANPPDAFLVDWHMPGLDGLSALHRLREAYGSRALPASVMVTVSEASEVRAAPHGNLVAAVLTKPVSSSALFNGVNAAVVNQQGSYERLLRSTRLDPSGALWLSGLRLLVVDDSDVNLDVARHLLERQGAEVQTASDGRAAIQALQAGNFDAVLMDVQMPVLDGNEATRELRRDPRMASLPIIALTAGALQAERQRSLDAGMSDFLSKPLDPEQLVRTLRRHVERARGELLPARVPTSIAGDDRPAGLHEGGEASTSAPRWPQISGIASQESHQRLGGDRGLLLRLLRRLLAEFQHLAATPSAGWQAEPGDVRQLAAHLHKLRGAAGMVAATSVRRLAGEAERAAQGPAPGPALARLMPLLDDALQDLARHAGPWIEAQERDSRPPAADDAQLERIDLSAIDALRRRLADADLSALAEAAAMQASLRAHLGRAGYRDFASCLDALDFVGAQELLASRAKAAPV